MGHASTQIFSHRACQSTQEFFAVAADSPAPLPESKGMMHFHWQPCREVHQYRTSNSNIYKSITLQKQNPNQERKMPSMPLISKKTRPCHTRK